MSPPKAPPRRRWDSLRHRAEFLHLQQHGQKWVTPAFVVYAASDKKLDRPQVGFTVTKKQGGAVIRNRIRRRLRAAVDEITLPLWRIVVIAREEALSHDFQLLVRDVKWALSKLEVRMKENARDK